jgi:hypothetical protein
MTETKNARTPNELGNYRHLLCTWLGYPTILCRISLSPCLFFTMSQWSRTNLKVCVSSCRTTRTYHNESEKPCPAKIIKAGRS